MMFAPNRTWIVGAFYQKHGTTLYDVWQWPGQPARLDTYTSIKDAREGYPDAALLPDVEALLRLCHNAPMAANVDTRSLESAIRRLVEFAWEMVQW